MHMAKGGPGTVEQQYFLTPAPIYGFDPQYKRDQLSLEGSYEIINNLQIRLSHSIYQMQPLLRNSLTTNQTSIGIQFSAF